MLTFNTGSASGSDSAARRYKTAKVHIRNHDVLVLLQQLQLPIGIQNFNFGVPGREGVEMDRSWQGDPSHSAAAKPANAAETMDLSMFAGAILGG